VDQVSTARKMNVFEIPGERMMVLMTAGNLSISQSVRQLLSEHIGSAGYGIWTAPNMYEAARLVGEVVRMVHERDAKSLAEFGIEFNVSLIFGGQIKGERCRMFQVYSAGNFIESHNENTYFQIGEAKYGKPIIDRVVTPGTPLDEAAKCALISMDSTLRSNISVGLPLDLLVYDNNSLAVTRFVTIDERNQYFQMIRSTWGQQLKSIFEGLAAPVWDAAPEINGNVLSSANASSQPVRMPLPAGIAAPAHAATPLQTVAQQFHAGQQ
jgi:putative proteasome-type protease